MSESKRDRAIQSIENIRNRLRDLVDGDEHVDIGTLLYSLNENLAEIGGRKIELSREHIRIRFFEERDR